MELGNKIAIIGVAGSGKSTLAIALNYKLTLPIYHTDQFSWANGWDNPKSNNEIVAYIDHILEKDQWLIEGYLGYTSLPDTRLQAADMVIVLDYSKIILAWHILKRILKYNGKRRPEMPDQCIERFGRHTIEWCWKHFTKKTCAPIFITG